MLDQRAWVSWLSVTASNTGPLAGQRLAVKDMFDIAGYVTGAGNPDWRASRPVAVRTAPAVQALCHAGAHLVGKTQTDELAYSLNGANIHYGTPRNPAAPDRLPGGSSSGSATAVASGDADIGLGTDTGGSIRVPSSYCGLYGFRPSWGAIDISGCVPLAPRFDTVGFICRTPELLAAVGEVLLPEQEGTAPEGMKWLSPEGLQPNTDAVAAQCERLGWTLHDEVILTRTLMNTASEAFRTLQGREIWRTHGNWVRSVRPRFAPDVAARFEWASTLTEDDEITALKKADRVVTQLECWSEGGRLALALPSAPGAAPLLSQQGITLAHYRDTLIGMTALAGLWGAPVLAAPWLEDEGAPWGVSVVGAPGSDLGLLKAARRLA